MTLLRKALHAGRGLSGHDTMWMFLVYYLEGDQGAANELLSLIGEPNGVVSELATRGDRGDR
jgi:hypothetical protein